jgi:hypothetical protein
MHLRTQHCGGRLVIRIVLALAAALVATSHVAIAQQNLPGKTASYLGFVANHGAHRRIVRLLESRRNTSRSIPSGCQTKITR